MKERNFHANIRLIFDGTNSTAIVKERIWRPLVSFHFWLENGISAEKFVYNGIGITIIMNSAIIVEGIVSDIIEEELTYSDSNKNSKESIEKITWKNKVRLYNRLFKKKLTCYKNYEIIEALFHFRNNLAHGLSHLEQSSINAATNERSKITSKNDKYQIIRKILIKKSLMQETLISSNVNHLWNFENAIYFWDETKTFIEDLLVQNESVYKFSIIDEWKTAISGKG